MSFIGCNRVLNIGFVLGSDQVNAMCSRWLDVMNNRTMQGNFDKIFSMLLVSAVTCKITSVVVAIYIGQTKHHC